MNNDNQPDFYGDDEPTDAELDAIEAEQDADTEGQTDPLVGLEDDDDDFDFGDDEDFVFDSEE